MLNFQANCIALILTIVSCANCSPSNREELAFPEDLSSAHRLLKRAAVPAKSNTAVSCAVPAVSTDRTFTLYDSKNQAVKSGAGSPTPHHITFQCAKGYLFVDGRDTSTSYCNSDKGGWDPPLKVQCQRVCSALPNSSTAALTCKDKVQGIVDCNRPLFSGAQVTSKCKPRHHTQPPSKADHQNSRCQDDGKWDKQVIVCVPDSS